MEAKKRGRPSLYDYEALAIELYNELEQHPEGVEMRAITEALDIPEFVAYKVITRLRCDLGDGDVITVPVVRVGRKHIYKLDATLKGTRDWMAKRFRHEATMAKTNTATFKALVKGLDGRTKSGRVASRSLLSATRFEEDLELFLAELSA